MKKYHITSNEKTQLSICSCLFRNIAQYSYARYIQSVMVLVLCHPWTYIEVTGNSSWWQELYLVRCVQIFPGIFRKREFRIKSSFVHIIQTRINQQVDLGQEKTQINRIVNLKESLTNIRFILQNMLWQTWTNTKQGEDNTKGQKIKKECTSYALFELYCSISSDYQWLEQSSLLQPF